MEPSIARNRHLASLTPIDSSNKEKENTRSDRPRLLLLLLLRLLLLLLLYPILFSLPVLQLQFVRRVRGAVSAPLRQAPVVAFLSRTALHTQTDRTSQERR